MTHARMRQLSPFYAGITDLHGRTLTVPVAQRIAAQHDSTLAQLGITGPTVSALALVLELGY